MSLGIVIKGTEGIVLAADSRVTLINHSQPNPNLRVETPVNFDNSTKLLAFSEPNNFVGAVTFGDAVIGTTASNLRTIHSFIPEFEVGLADDDRLSIQDFSQRLSDFYLQQCQDRMPANYTGTGTVFVVGGFNSDSPYGSVFQFNIPKLPMPVEESANDFGVVWGGQQEIADRILNGYDARVLEITKATLGLDDAQIQLLTNALSRCNLVIPYQVLPLQDCINAAIFLIKTTADAQMLSVGIRGVGGLLM